MVLVFRGWFCGDFTLLFPAPISKEEMFMKTVCMPDCSLGDKRLVYRLLCARLKWYKLVQVHSNNKRQGCRGQQCNVLVIGRFPEFLL